MKKEEILAALNEAYFSTNPHERRVLERLPRLMKGVRSFADVGASLGQFTKCANECLTDATITAIEADPLRYEELVKNCSRWQLEGRNKIECRHSAVLDASRMVDFHVSGTSVSGALTPSNISHLSTEQQAQVQWRNVTIAGCTLDSLYPDAPPDFVKMDIEGGELLALRGAIKILAARQTLWLIELHDFEKNRRPTVPEAVRILFKENGYREIVCYGKSLFYCGSPTRFKWLWARHILLVPFFLFKRFVKRLLRRA